MNIRIYKALLNGKETIDSYTVWFKPTKKAIENGAHINAWHCNVIGDKVWGYWGDYSATTRVHLDVKLGKRMGLDKVPKPIRKWAERKQRIFDKACESGDWTEWNNA